MSLINRLLGVNPDKKEILKNGAVIIDVRTEREFASGHVDGSLNIPLDKLGSQMHTIDKSNKPVVLCCASGVRSARATSILKSNGFDAHNGGSWSSVNAQKNEINGII